VNALVLPLFWEANILVCRDFGLAKIGIQPIRL